MEDYITHMGLINWERAEKFIWILGEHEHEIFRERIDTKKQEKRNEIRTVSVT